ncbi:hypothetical protein PI125_g23303 [Phytophthora idaei]|nr:hypothetical protein PI125_g23303 [Phytophthora idaei]
MALRWIGVCAGIVESLSLLEAGTMRHQPVAFFTQSVGLECGDTLSRTCPARQRLWKKASIAYVWSRGSDHCRVTQYLAPGVRPVSCRTPRSGGSTAGTFSGKISMNSRTRGATGLPDASSAGNDWVAYRASRTVFGSAGFGRVRVSDAEASASNPAAAT